MTIAVYTEPGTDLHSALCDGFMLHGGWVTIEEDFYEILTMTPGHGPGGRKTRWWLRQAPAGTA